MDIGVPAEIKTAEKELVLPRVRSANLLASVTMS